jgi:hypothetical protein
MIFTLSLQLSLFSAFRLSITRSVPLFSPVIAKFSFFSLTISFLVRSSWSSDSSSSYTVVRTHAVCTHAHTVVRTIVLCSSRPLFACYSATGLSTLDVHNPELSFRVALYSSRT